ncbi:uncharacterized protein LOC130724830 [Lotus japonicus]|uniref:uncharacterized protein LOC130724830 n=1 Tax=Lotus japonicus TaxID=34305 RepID=UPI002587EE25|nr:uncharacterized protein LOC130724830 [Lotus japonicus]
MGGCGVIRDHLSRWVAGCYSGTVAGNAFRAEAKALVEVLELAWNRGLRRLICDVDCDNLVKILEDAGAIQLHSEFQVLFPIIQLLARDWHVRINSVHRDSNAVADLLARRGVVASTSGVWILDSPDHDVEYILLKDSLSIP